VLTTIREKTQGIIATFIFALVIIPFALWGTYSYFQGGTDTNVAEVNGVKISQQTYRTSLDRVIAANGGAAALADNPAFKQEVLNALIDQALMVQNEINQGYHIGDKDLAHLIRDTPQFKRDGRFDPALYERVLQREGMNEQVFEQRLRAIRIKSQIQAGLTESTLLLPTDKDLLLRVWQQTRLFDYVVIEAKNFASDVRVPEEDIKQYYDTHPDEFKTPEQVRIAYIELSAKSLGAEYKPTEEELRKAYADESARYISPARRRVSHILVDVPAKASADQQKQALEKADKIEKELRAGADFATLAKKLSADSGTASKGGDLGYVNAGMLPPALEQAVSALNKAGEITAPVKTSYGYHIARLTEFTPEVRKTFEQARGDVEKAVRERKGQDEFYAKVEQLNNLVYEHPDSLEPAATALGLKVSHSDWFTREGGQGIAAQPKVVEAAFSSDVLADARNSDAIDIGANAVVALRVDEHRAAARKPLAEVHGEIEAILRKEQTHTRAADVAAEVLKALQTGKPLAGQAQAHNLKVEQAQISRIDPKTIDPNLVTAVFKAQKPSDDKAAYGEADLRDKGYAVFALKSITEAAPDKADNALARRVQSLLEQRHGADIYNDYVARLRDTAKIKIHADKL
jgi:peptidyl-prolyl cis-trans isomerase D